MADKINPEDTSNNGRKNDFGKARFSLIPVKAMMALAQLFTMGAEKYGDRNWEKGMKFDRLYDAGIRHLLKYWAGEEYDPVDGQHHLIAAAWNALVLYELRETHPEMDDREPQNKRFPNSELMFADDNLADYTVNGLDGLNVDQLELIKAKIQKEINDRKNPPNCK